MQEGLKVGRHKGTAAESKPGIGYMRLMGRVTHGEGVSRGGGRNSLYAEPRLGVDECLGILNMWSGTAMLSGLVAS